MASQKQTQEDFADIVDAPVPDGTVQNIPMPAQQVIDQQAVTAPQMTPEEAAVHGRRPSTKNASKQRTVDHSNRSMKQIVDEFLAEISVHPDCKLLNSTLGGRPAKQVSFTDTPTSNQHMVELRFAWRDAVLDSVMQSAENDQKSAYEPGGKYYDLIPRRGDQQAPELAQEGGRKSWDHLIQKRQQVEAVAT